MSRRLKAGWLLFMACLLSGAPGLPPLPVIGKPSVPVVASWYGSAHEGRKTASGAIFRRAALTAAHRTAKFGTRYLVFYQNQVVEVLVNDRGPYVKKEGRFIRDLDLSEAAALTLGLTAAGVARVIVREVNIPEVSSTLEALLPKALVQVANLEPVETTQGE